MEALALSRRHVLLAVGVAAILLVLAGRYVGGSGAAAGGGETARALPVAAPREQRFVVHVVGAVRRPGLYRLREGSRVADAVGRAGGATPKADLALVNLAAPVADGTQIVVPRRTPPSAGGGTGGGASGTAGPVHLNTATLEELDALPGVGPVTAQEIIDYREQHGAFSSVDDLDAIPGIGPKRLEQLREVAAP
ncbi:MAG: helix-hairpin-helix domain-containing protein [Thermoleophilia bacterium]|nr:helix-hairpin-helix domain-containing protein [Thermoleophilia bacterium]